MLKDHKGQCYSSINEMAARYDLNPSTLRYRLREWGRKGVSLACILTMPSDRHALRHFSVSDDDDEIQMQLSNIDSSDDTKRTRCVECQDHLGQTFPSIRDMCDHWGISYQVYSSRIHREHWSVEMALTTPISDNANQPIIDPNGVWWESISKMCKAWNINEKTFKSRMKTGQYEMIEALTLPPKNQGGRKTKSA